jgi:hypothetical protein
MNMKKCTKCKIEKCESEFYKLNREPSGLNYRCIDCVKEYRHSSKEKERAANYHRSNKYRELDRKRDKTPERRESRNKRQRERGAVDPIYRARRNLRRRVNLALKRGRFTKKSSLFQYLGCDIPQLKAHLESLFQPGMSWDNYGLGMDKWNIDHKIPLASASTLEILYKLCHYTNLQPLWQPINLIKSSKITF